MKRQKRIALVNDITGFGRCSVTVELPLISAMKIQACPLPTAILSVHTGFPNHYLDDYTARMEPYIKSWEANGLAFDGICTGFLGSAEQIAIVLDFIHRFKGSETRVMVDPVMGDYGKLYPSYTQEMCDKMRRLLGVADLVTPNLTEACQLLDIPYPEDGIVTMGRCSRWRKHSLRAARSKSSSRDSTRGTSSRTSSTMRAIWHRARAEDWRRSQRQRRRLCGHRRGQPDQWRRARGGCAEGRFLHQPLPSVRTGARPAVELRPAL